MNTLRFLSEYQSTAPMNELLLLLSKATGETSTKLLIQNDLVISKDQKYVFTDHLNRLKNGEPLPYILGEWGFYDLMFEVTPDVLIPRPETEMLIEQVLQHFPDEKAKISILDVGTGSGIIPITLAVKYPNALLQATDISTAALAIAKRNASKHNVADRIHFYQADLIPKELINARIEVITANLPYIPSETVKTLEIYGKEPTLALDGGTIGTELIEALLTTIALDHIDFTLLTLEFEYRQGAAVRSLCARYFPDKKTTIHQDLAGLDRIAVTK